MGDVQKMRMVFKAETLTEFIERYAVDVSLGGMFIRVRDPLGVGTELSFDLQLRGGGALFQGMGRVVWARAWQPAEPSLVPGFGLRFEELNPSSLETFKQVLRGKAAKELLECSDQDRSEALAELETELAKQARLCPPQAEQAA